MGNCFEQCGSKIMRLDSKNFKYNPFEEKKIEQSVNVKSFKRLKVLGKGALGTVFLVEMKHTSFVFLFYM